MINKLVVAAVSVDKIRAGKDSATLAVGIGEIRASKDSATVLAAYGLGSCIGIAVYDPVARIGGMAHVLLPSSKEATHHAPSFKFADTAVPALMEELERLGAYPRRLICKIAGGAQMLSALSTTDGFRIGERNVKAVEAALETFGVVPKAMDVGGSRGRTLRLIVSTGAVLVRTSGQVDVRL